MLQVFRSKLAGVFVQIIMVILILSFALWGVGEYFVSGGGDNPLTAVVAEVQRVDIFGNELRNEVDKEMNVLRSQLGAEVDMKMARQFGLVDRSLNKLVTQRLFDIETAKLGLTVSDDKIMQQVINQSVFQNEIGQFDRNRFRQILLSNGMSEQAYINAIREDMIQKHLVQSVIANVDVPDTLARLLYQHQNEERLAKMVQIPTSRFRDVGTPSETQLQETYEQNTARFQTPEVRSFSYVMLNLKDALDESHVDEEAVRAEYERNIDNYTVPEARKLTQVVVDTQAQAQDIYDAYAQTGDLASAIQQAGLEVRPTSLGSVTTDETLPELSEVFDLEKGALIQPVETDFGWHVVKVEEIIPPVIETFESVKEELQTVLAQEIAAESFYNRISEIEDSLFDNNDLKSVADTFGLKLQNVTDVKKDNTSVAADLLTQAFDTPEKETSDIFETKDGSYYVLEVTNVQSPQAMPLADVKKRVADIWKETERFKKADELAKDIANKIQQGGDIDQIALENNLAVVNSPKLKRGNSYKETGFDEAIVTRLFGADNGAPAVISSTDAMTVAVVTDIQSNSSSGSEEDLQTIREETVLEMANEFLMQYSNALKDKLGVKIHTQAVDALF